MVLSGMTASVGPRSAFVLLRETILYSRHSEEGSEGARRRNFIPAVKANKFTMHD